MSFRQIQRLAVLIDQKVSSPEDLFLGQMPCGFLGRFDRRASTPDQHLDGSVRAPDDELDQQAKCWNIVSSIVSQITTTKSTRTNPMSLTTMIFVPVPDPRLPRLFT